MRLRDPRRCGWLLTVLLAASACGQTLAHKGWAGSGITVEPWWQRAVFYQIDPVSFQDSKGDGFGDLTGIVQRLDYLQSLGVDAIMLSPFQLQAEFSRTGSGPPFDPKYGSEEDLDRLLREASRRKIRVFVDVALGASRTVPELANVARFWLSRGIAGLRLKPEQVDSHSVESASGDRRGSMSPPVQMADRMRELRRVAATYAGQRVLLWDMPASAPVGRTRGISSRRRAEGETGSGDAPQMVAERALASLPQWNAESLRRALAVQQNAGTIAVPVSDGPETTRSFDRLGDGVHDVEIARVLATALLATGGTPMLYFGQEIGMATTPAASASTSAKADPTPMQWGGDAGFSSGVPWIEMGRNAPTANVALEDTDSASLLNWYRRLNALRHGNAALRGGTMEMIAASNSDAVAWVRQVRGAGTTAAPVVVVCNPTGRPLTVSVAAELRRLGLQPSGMMHTLLSTSVAAADALTGPVSVNSISLSAYGVYIGELGRGAGLESLPSPLPHRRSKRAR